MTRETEQKHTPGPTWRSVWPGEWKYDGMSYVWSDGLKGGQTTPVQVRGWGYLTGGGHGALGIDEATARKIQDDLGRLIAAAPELLSGLDLIEDRCRTHALAAREGAERVATAEERAIYIVAAEMFEALREEARVAILKATVSLR